MFDVGFAATWRARMVDPRDRRIHGGRESYDAPHDVDGVRPWIQWGDKSTSNNARRSEGLGPTVCTFPVQIRGPQNRLIHVCGWTNLIELVGNMYSIYLGKTHQYHEVLQIKWRIISRLLSFNNLFCINRWKTPRFHISLTIVLFVDDGV